MYLPWYVALIASAGSLFFSNVMNLPPCSLCWWQRIFMFPLAIILGVGFIRKERQAAYYALPLALIGWGIALYHNLLYYGFVEKALVPCTGDTSCTEKQIEWLGFISIPLLSLATFSLLIALMGVQLMHQREQPS